VPRIHRLNSIATCLYFALAGPLLAAPTVNADSTPAPASGSDTAPAKFAEACRNDLKNFSLQMDKDGYWVAGAGDSLGYPVGAAGYGMYDGTINESGIQARASSAWPGGYTARAGYEVRVLLDSANILARHGQQQPCEDVLTETRGLYKSYLSDMQRDRVPPFDLQQWRTWRQLRITAALPVKGSNVAFRADELLGVEVRSPDGVALGSVDDLAVNPDTGKLGYLVIARGGFMGFDEAHIPVPWEDFKAAPKANLLVLDTTKSVLDAAPRGSKNPFTVGAGADGDSQKVDAYWRANRPAKVGP